MRSRTAFSIVLAGASLMSAGCFGGGNSLPDSVTVALPDGTTVDATLGSGVLALADTTWDFTRVADNARGDAFARINFGPEGELASFENNTLASNIFGSTLVFDGQRHDTQQPAVQYAAATYGAETSDATGFTFEVRLTAFAAGFQAATATVSASAEFDPDDPNTVRGTFIFSSRVTLISIPGGNQDDTFSFEGRRVIEQPRQPK